MIIRRREDEDSKLTECKLWNSIETRLVNFFECDKGGAIAIISKLKEKVSARNVLDKLVDCARIYLERMHTKDEIGNKAGYIINTLKREYL